MASLSHDSCPCILLEKGYFKTSQTWVGMFLKHTITAGFYFLWLCTKQERRRIWRIGAILKKKIKTHKTTSLAYNTSLPTLKKVWKVTAFGVCSIKEF